MILLNVQEIIKAVYCFSGFAQIHAQLIELIHFLKENSFVFLQICTLTLVQWQLKLKRSQGKYDGTYHASYRMVVSDRHKHQHIGNNKRTI